MILSTQDTIVSVPCLTQENHSFKQIIGCEYVMSQSTKSIAHAHNDGEVEVIVANGKLDGSCYATNMAYV